MKTTEIIIQFIPIVIIFMLLKFSNHFVRFSFTILGKLLAVVTILLYSSIDIIAGLFVCGLVILYYQSDYVENMLNFDDSLNIDDITKVDFGDIITPEQLYFNYDVNGIPDDGVYLVPMSESTGAKYRKRKVKKLRRENKQTKCENMENYSVYDDNFKPSNDLISRFKNENCTKDGLKYKDITVKNDMAEHVFQELAFENGEPCNPCSTTCKYSIIEEKIKIEEKMKPISTSQ